MTAARTDRAECFTLSLTLRLKVWARRGAGAQTEGLSTAAIWPRGTTPPRATAGCECTRRASPPAASPTSRPEARGPTLQLEKQARTPGAPRARAAGRAVSSNSNPPRPRTPPPAQAAAQQRGAPGADRGPIPDPGAPSRGGPVGAADKGARQGRGGRAGRAWKALEAHSGTHHGRGRAGPDPRGLRASRTRGPGTRAHGAHDQGPRWPAATSEGAPGTGAVRGAARADHGEREATGLSGGCRSADR